MAMLIHQSFNKLFSIYIFNYFGGKFQWEKIVLLLFMKWKPAVSTHECALGNEAWLDFDY